MQMLEVMSPDSEWYTGYLCIDAVKLLNVTVIQLLQYKK
jgi:hypothetical protein